MEPIDDRFDFPHGFHSGNSDRSDTGFPLAYRAHRSAVYPSSSEALCHPAANLYGSVNFIYDTRVDTTVVFLCESTAELDDHRRIKERLFSKLMQTQQTLNSLICRTVSSSVTPKRSVITNAPQTIRPDRCKVLTVTAFLLTPRHQARLLHPTIG